MRLRSSTKDMRGRQKGPLLKKSSIQPLDKMPIVVLDSLIQRLDPKSLLALKNTNWNFARAIESNRNRLWKRFWAVNEEIICSSNLSTSYRFCSTRDVQMRLISYFGMDPSPYKKFKIK